MNTRGQTLETEDNDGSCTSAVSPPCLLIVKKEEQIDSQDDYDTMGRSFLRHKQPAAGRGTRESHPIVNQQII